MTREEELWKKDYAVFDEATAKFYQKEMDAKTYKGISGNFGSYAQKGASASMLRLRLPAGRLTKEKLNFIASAIEEYQINKAHFTTCQAIQLHNLNEKTVTELAAKALSVGIVTRGGGGDNPRNTMMSPLAGVEKGEYFSVVPYALCVGEFAMRFINMPKMPRKLKICFSSTASNVPHATFRDLGFVAREDGAFDVYAAGGLGNKPLLGVQVAEKVDPKEILYYVQAMHDVFCAYGDYENRAHARTRFLQEICGGVEGFKARFNEYLAEAKAKENLTITPEMMSSAMTGVPCEKCSASKASKATPDDSILASRRVVEQKQKGLYAVKYHPAGGSPDVAVFRRIYDTIKDMDKVELRVAPDESVYAINLTADEARAFMAATPDSAETVFQESVACIGATICQQGVRDSQGLLKTCLEMEKAENLPDGVLPAIHISGCTSSCSAHQTGYIGFHGGVKLVDKVPTPAFTLHLGGNEKQGSEKLGEQVGVLLERDIPTFLKEVGKTVQQSGMDFDAWVLQHPEGVKDIAKKYLV